jgi:signal transduction histidine kinase
MATLPRFLPFAVAATAVLGTIAVSRRRAAAAGLRIAELENESAHLLREVQRSRRLKDDFLATLSHELRTPLNAMLGWVQLLRVHADDRELRDHALEVVERNARTQVQIVRDMLDVSRIITGRMRLDFAPVDLEDIVRAASGALEATAAVKGVELRVDVEPLGGEVYGDAPRLRQVAWNLISNAVKFTPQGGRVTVQLRRQPCSAEMSVADTGIGIAPDMLPFVFDRFRQADSSVTRSFGGVGLGLAIVKHLVELHGGSVRAVSEGPDRGATFTVSLPVRTSDEQGGRAGVQVAPS